MNRDWTQSSVTETKNPGKIGMFGKGDDYYFYMDFVANNSVDLWNEGAFKSKTFRMLFQMGNT